MENYLRMETIGEGSFGEVFKALHLNCGVLFAMKRVIHPPAGGMPSTILREVSAMNALDSKYIVKYVHKNTGSFVLRLKWDC